MKTVTYDPHAGSHIANACQEAVAMAIRGKQKVKFSFNGVELIATPDSDPAKLEVEFIEKLEADSKTHRESPKGIAEAEGRTAEILRKQRSVNTSLAVLKDIVGDHDKLMLWLKSFTEDADDIGVQFTKARLADELEAAGYAENEHVGQKPEWFCTRKRMTHYIVGQAINCLRIGMPPHPVTASFVEKYFKIQDATSATEREG